MAYAVTMYNVVCCMESFIMKEMAVLLFSHI